MKCWILVSIYFTVSLPYLFMRFLGVPEESDIMMIFAPVYIYTDCLAFHENFSLNILMDLDSMSKSYGILMMALLDILMPVVEA